MKLVKFGNGKYGVRVSTFLFRHKYIDLESPKYTHSKASEFFICCQGSYEQAIEVYGMFNEEPVSI